jgi:hypothetical protein
MDAMSREKDIQSMKRQKDSEIDLSDIPERKDWRKASRLVIGRKLRECNERMEYQRYFNLAAMGSKEPLSFGEFRRKYILGNKDKNKTSMI